MDCMSSILQITPVTDADGQPCFTQADAQKLAQMLAQDEAQPYDFASSCGYRTELMIGRLLEAGAPPAAVARVMQELPKGEKSLMHVNPDGSDRGSFDRLLGLPPETDTGTYPLPGTDVKIKFYGNGRILVQDENETKGWDLEDGKGYRMSVNNAPWQGGDHITVGIYVLDPATNKATLTVIDPHLSKANPMMTPVEWKAAVNCEASIVLAGKIGELAHILPETLSERQREKFDTAVKKHGGSRYAPLTRQQENAVTQEMFNAESPNAGESLRDLSGVINWKFPAVGEQMNYKEKTSLDRKRADHRTTTDWDSLKPDEQAGLTQRWISELAPLRVLQDKWQEKFPPGTPKHEAEPLPQKPKASISAANP